MRAMTSSMSSTANMMRRRPNVFAGAFGAAVVAVGLVELRQLEPAVTVGRPHECDLDSNLIESDDAVHPVALDGCRATVQLHAELDEEGDSSFEVVDDDTDMVHPLDRHVADPRVCTSRVIADASTPSLSASTVRPATSDHVHIRRSRARRGATRTSVGSARDTRLRHSQRVELSVS